MKSPDIGNEPSLYPYAVPEFSPLHSLRQAMASDAPETAWGHTVQAMEQTSEEFYILAMSAVNDRVKLSALKTYERLVREIARHFEWLTKRDQKEHDSAAKKLKALNSEDFAAATVKTLAERETANTAHPEPVEGLSGKRVSLQGLDGARPERYPAPAGGDLKTDAGASGTVSTHDNTEKHGTLSRRDRRYLERQQLKAAKKAAKQAKRTEEKLAA